jgi:hypothetical protein
MPFMEKIKRKKPAMMPLVPIGLEAESSRIHLPAKSMESINSTAPNTPMITQR